MGFPTFFSYIKKNKNVYLEDIKFPVEKIIIDGNNLMYFIAKRARIFPQYGGNYDAYRSYMDRFFEILKDSKIEFKVILDGCKSQNEWKLKNLTQRHQYKLQRCVKCLSHGIKDWRRITFPMLMRQEFMIGLQRNEVSHVTEYFEADYTIAELANHENCFILSNDTDFFFYELKKGVVPFYSLNFEKYEKNGKSGGKLLINKCFSPKSWNRKFSNLNPRLIVLGGILHGNDNFTFPKEKLLDILKKNAHDDLNKGTKFEINENTRYLPKNPKILIEATFSWLNKVQDYKIAIQHVKKRVLRKKEDYWHKLKTEIEKYLLKYQSPNLFVTKSSQKIPGKFFLM